jgi:HEAT repeat protein
MSRDHAAGRGLGRWHVSAGELSGHRPRSADATDRLRAVLATRSASELTASLDDSSPEVARTAIRRLAELEGARAAPELRARLLSSDLAVVADIAKALRRLGDGSAVELAIGGLRGEPYTGRLAAARALGALGDARAAQALGGALHDPIAGVRVAALGALADIGPDTGAAEDCARLLSDPDAHVRIAAVRAVARTAARPGALLERSAGDRDRLVRLEVARHLGGLPDEAASALLADRDLRVREAAARAAGSRQVGQLAVLLAEDPASDVRHAAAATLGKLADQRIADILVPGLEDPDAIVRAAVLRALVDRLTRSGAISRLCGELGSGRPERRRASLYALSHLQAREFAADVGRLVDDPDPDVRLALLQVADGLLPDPEPLIRYLEADTDAAVRDAAENWLVRHRARGRTDA